MIEQKKPQAIRQPEHDRIQLSYGLAYVIQDGENGGLGVHVTARILDANDAIRLGAFLTRFYVEQGQAEQRAEAQAIARNRAARDRARHERTARQAAVRAVK